MDFNLGEIAVEAIFKTLLQGLVWFFEWMFYGILGGNQVIDFDEI